MKRGRGRGLKSNFRKGAFGGTFGHAAGDEEDGGTGVSVALLRQARKSGQLNLSNRSLKEVPDEVWRINLDARKDQEAQSMSGDDRWWDQIDLSKLDLSSNQLKSLSNDIQLLPALVALDIRDNELEYLPEVIGELQQLNKLILSHNSLKSIPSTVGKLENLTNLMLDRNKVNELPSDVGNLAHLDVLDLSHNQLSQLPLSIGQLSCLRSLNLSNNKLIALPVEFANLRGLKDLNVSSNQIMKLNVDFRSLNKLMRLDLRCNRVEEIPNFASGNALKELFLGSNQIGILAAPTVEVLTELTMFDLSNNKVESIPEEIVNMKKLERFDVTNNNVSSLPYSMGNMTVLKSLILHGNPLRGLRRDIIQRGTVAILNYLRSRITEQTSTDEKSNTQASSVVPEKPFADIASDLSRTGCLNYSDKKVSSIPNDLWAAASKSSQIAKINLSKNTFVEFPSQLIDVAANVVDLNLSFNRLSTLPSSMSAFSNLTFLDLRNNQLSDIPMEMKSIKLRQIALSRNRLTVLPPVIYSLLSLEVILASENKIESIDVDGLSHLSELTTLDLQNNNIKEVPPQLGAFEKLRSLQLAGNLFRTPRPAILAKGTVALLEYLKDRIPAS